jgi:hypothetical protein
VTRLLRDVPEEFRALRDATAARIGTDPRAIEKDYWATEVLRSIVTTTGDREAELGAPPPMLVFKGGTSLSKAYGLIDRFSEDIDLLVATDATGKRLRRVLRGVADRVTESLELPATTEHAGRGFLNVRFGTPTATKASFLTDGVLLELGARGGPEPNERRTIGSLMTEAAAAIDPRALLEFTDLAMFDILALAPVRTLAEKLAFLHHRASILDLDGLRRGARHLYDVTLVLRDADVREALTINSMQDLMRDIDARSAAAGWPFTPRPDDGFAGSPAFSDTGPKQNVIAIREALATGMRDIDELVRGDLPTVGECLDEVRRWSHLL